MRTLIFFGGLLLLPVLILTGVTLWFIERENQRWQEDLERVIEVRTSSFQTAQESLAGTLLVALEEVKEGLLEALGQGTPAQFSDLVRSNSLVAAAHLWQPDRGIAPALDPAFPLPSRLPWQVSFREEPATAREAGVQESFPQAQVLARRQLNVIARQNMEPPAAPTLRSSMESLRAEEPSRAAPDALAQPGPLRRGWFWHEFQSKQTLWLWLEGPPRSGVYLARVDVQTLRRELSRLLPPTDGSGGVRWSLSPELPQLDKGRTSLNGEIAGWVPLGDALPGWGLGYSETDASLPTVPLYGGIIGSGLVTVNGIIIALGGLLLWRDATRARREAAQKTTFLATVSHELRTPITAILLHLQLLEAKREAGTEQVAKHFSIMRRESGRLERLVSNLLTYSSREHQRRPQPIELRETCPLSIVNEQLDLLAPEIAAAGLVVSVYPPETGILVKTDPDALARILRNLIENVVKYAADGKDLSLELRRQSPPTGAEILISDRGPGIPAKARKRAFRPFSRVNEALTRQKGGVGLGLSIAQCLAKDLHATLSYRERAGGGATFKLSFPPELTL